MEPFEQFKKHEKHPWMSHTLSKVAGLTSISSEIIRRA